MWECMYMQIIQLWCVITLREPRKAIHSFDSSIDARIAPLKGYYSVALPTSARLKRTA